MCDHVACQSILNMWCYRFNCTNIGLLQWCSILCSSARLQAVSACQVLRHLVLDEARILHRPKLQHATKLFRHSPMGFIVDASEATFLSTSCSFTGRAAVNLTQALFCWWLGTNNLSTAQRAKFASIWCWRYRTHRNYKPAKQIAGWNWSVAPRVL